MKLSFTGKRWLIQEWDEPAVRELSKGLSIDPALAGVLFLRGLRTREQGRVFLESSLGQLTNPTVIPGLIESADRIIEAVTKKEKICIYGDYDVDGITATSLVVLVLRRLGADLFYVIPNRLEQGYGLHSDSVHQIRDAGADLLITVDNGIAAREEVSLARSMGMDVIITDHHEPPARLPDTPYIVNPKMSRPSEPGHGASPGQPFSILAGVGLAFVLMVGVRARLRERQPNKGGELPNLREYLDLVAMGTIADVVPISGENRILVRHGLNQIGRSRNMGIRALMRVSGLKTESVTPGQVGFMLAPRINAAGRLGDGELALKLLISSDKREVEQAASILNQENLKRQEVEKEILEEALEAIERAGRDDRVIVVHGEKWHPGVIGIVASRIVERFYRPTIVISQKQGRGTGSARSIPGFSMYQAFSACQEHLAAFGGHDMAAGLTLAWDRIPAFRKCINLYADRHLTAEDLVPAIKVEGVVGLEKACDAFLNDLEKLKPFGWGNPEPTFLARGVNVTAPRIVGENHVRFQVSCRDGALSAIGFNMKDCFDLLRQGTPLDLLYHLRYNDFNGSRSIQAVLVDLRASGET